MYVLGVLLQDQKVTQKALTAFYGIGPTLARKLCARLQIHDKCKVRQLTPTQITGLASFLSSPLTSAPVPRYPLAHPHYVPPPPGTPISQIKASSAETAKTKAATGGTGPTGLNANASALQQLLKSDPLRGIKVESELRKEVKENIAHQRAIGSYVGKRHAMSLPVRGQNTQNNAKTARKLNRVDRSG